MARHAEALAAFSSGLAQVEIILMILDDHDHDYDNYDDDHYDNDFYAFSSGLAQVKIIMVIRMVIGDDNVYEW